MGYPSISSEVFIIGMVTKNFVFFGLSFGVNNWVAAWGPARVFDTMGGIQVALCLLSGGGGLGFWEEVEGSFL